MAESDTIKAWIVRAEPKPPWDKCNRAVRRCPLPAKEKVFLIGLGIEGEREAKRQAKTQAREWAKDPHVKHFYQISYRRRDV